MDESFSNVDHIDEISAEMKVGMSQKVFEYLIILSTLLLCIFTFPLSFLLSVKFIKDYQRIVILRLGRVLNKSSCGSVYIIPFVDKYFIVDLRLVTFEVEPQQVLTSDSVTITVDAIVFYRVSNAIISVINIENSQKSTQLLAQTTIRSMIGLHSIYEILTDRQKIAASMQTVLDCLSLEWGIKVERIEIKDISLPPGLQKALSLEAEALRLSKAKILLAQGEQEASSLLRDAAETMASSSAPKECITLRYLQTLKSISTDESSIFIFALPSYVLKMASKKIGRQKLRKIA